MVAAGIFFGRLGLKKQYRKNVFRLELFNLSLLKSRRFFKPAAFELY